MGELRYDGPTVALAADRLSTLGAHLFEKVGCAPDTAAAIASHLVEADLHSIPSHGTDRFIQYLAEFKDGKRKASSIASVTKGPRGGWVIDGDNGNGIPAMLLATDHAIERAKTDGMSVTAIVNAGHTGRLGAFCETAAQEGLLTIILGGGGRKEWPQVAPFGGRKGLLPTNPYAFGIPGGDNGPVILDFATSAIAGGWIYASRRIGAPLPEGTIIDANGNPTTDPEDYFAGGAILPAAGPKGYGLALMAELIGEAMLSRVEGELNWLFLAIDTGLYSDGSTLQAMAEEILSEVRSAPPAPGFDRVEVPGERERTIRQRSGQTVILPEPTWQQITALAAELGVPTN